MSAMDSSGLVGVSAHSTRAGRSASASRTARISLSRTGRWLTPQPASTPAISRKVPPYASSGISTWSPGAQAARSRQSSAAIPDAKAKPAAPPSSAVRHSSRARRVGLAVREYS